jgi:amino acid transporter
MALSIALSVIATTGTGIVLTARIVYGMASYKTLPPFLATVNRRFSTPAAASVTAALLVVGLTWVYMLAASVQNVFADVVAVAGLLFTAFYILTALATVVYYRRRVIASAWDLLVLGVLPLSAAAFLGWILVRSLQLAPGGQLWSVAAILAVGLVLMLAARLVLRSPFFGLQRESDRPRH